jgi:hypothetical protein
MKLYNKHYDKCALLKYLSNEQQVAEIRRYTLTEGRAANCRILEFRTGAGLVFQVSADKGFDIFHCELNGMPVSFHSPLGMVHPSYYEPEGIGWFITFGGGFLTTCGLTYAGAPERIGNENFGLHGRIHATPAHDVCVEQSWIDDDYILSVKGKMIEGRMFGDNIEQTRSYTCTAGTNIIKIEDVFENKGFIPSPLMLIYHFNLGFPLIASGTKLEIPKSRISPRDEIAAQGLSEWNVMTEPVPGFKEQVFYHEHINPDNNGCIRATVTNIAGLGISIKYEMKELPILVQWKQMGSGFYVLGVEPSNCKVEGKSKEIAEKRIRYLQPQESIRIGIDVDVFQT